MGSTVRSVFSLLLGMSILLMGSGLVGTLLGLRAVSEGFSEFTIGLVMSAFFIGYIVGTWLMPALIGRVGHIRSFAALAALSAVVALLHGLWVDPVVWWVLRLINGISLLGTYMVIESWLNEQVVEKRGQVFAIYMMASLLALGIGQFLLLVYGPETVQSFMLVAILFALGLIPIALTPVTQPVPIQTARLPLRELYRRAPVGTAGAGVSGLVTGAFWGLAAVFAREVGLADSGVALFLSAAIFGGALLQYPIGHATDRRDRRKALIVVAAATAMGSVGIFLAIGHPPGLIVALALVWGGFAFSLYALSVAQTYDRLDASEALEATRGLLLMNGIGAALGPMLAGLVLVVTTASVLPLAFAGVLLLFIAFVGMELRREPPVPRPEMTEFVPVTRTSVVAAEIDPRTESDPHETVTLHPGDDADSPEPRP
ncbi:Putative Transmembrane transport protein [Thioalkalivibrio nitratireducens DSM 14787]|uniref:Transmembrane transport protein n=1 Tax=Thioalkalivibrio nitratireducens (strain DSM 14787 / UNIQEM 213 / ALEN2) TaxID=1255043 RepID=L0E0P5_THIND|nr:MFS transporter [Thioalkalivibrio nitratireducens]AGA34822.1 Putative Transmembrane transport protein [Thioalkalivibrio nitratireducens DSM 14787]